MATHRHRQHGAIWEGLSALAGTATVVLIMTAALASMVFGKAAFYDALGITPERQLIDAASRGDLPAMREAELRRGGFQWNRDHLGAMAMASAIAGDQKRAVCWLLDHGVPPDQPNALGQTPLMLACDRGCAEMADLLLLRGADIDCWDVWGNTAADYLATKVGEDRR